MKDEPANKSLSDAMNMQIPSFVCLCSGTGSNMLSILNSIKNQELRIKPLAIISNNPTAKALETAKLWGIKTFVLANDNISERDLSLYTILENLKPDFIILAGYIKKIPLNIIKDYDHKILNIHPSILPKHGGKGMYGIAVHKSVLDSGDEQSGVTVHLVTENFDEGPIILQEKVLVYKNDTPETLAKRVLEIEHQIYPKAIRLYLDSIYYSSIQSR